MCALIFWRSGLGLPTGTFCHFLQLSANHTSVFSFPDGRCIDIVESCTQLAFSLNLYRTVIGPTGFLSGRLRSDIDLIRMLACWFEIADGHFCFFFFFQVLTELSARDTSGFLFAGDNFSNYQWIFTKLGMCIDIVEIYFGSANGQISSIF